VRSGFGNPFARLQRTVELRRAVSSKIDVGSGHGLLVASIADAYFRLVARYELELAAARKRNVAVRKLKCGRAL
jgi:hypothetical protein